MKDCREQLLKDLEVYLSTKFNNEDLQQISVSLVKIIGNYEIIERCTDVIPLDDENERLLKRYAACLTIDGKSKHTVYQYIRTGRKLSEFIKLPFTKMGTYDIRYFLATEKERGISNVSLENTRANISAFFQWLTEEEVITKNPIAKIKPIKCKEEIKLPISDVEIDSLRSACKTKKERAIIELLLSSGIRVSELTAMKIKDINFSDLTVHVVNGKGDKERITYTTAVSAKHLVDYINDRKTLGENLFYNKNNEVLEPGGVRYILNNIAKKADVENVHPHRFRRTFATNLAKRGMSVQDIQVLLGHSSIKTTMEYVHTDRNKVQAEYNKYII